MDKEVLVNQLVKPLVEGLEKEGVSVKWIDLTPSRLGIDHFYLAVSAQWRNKMDVRQKIEAVGDKMFALPFEKTKHIDFILVYDSPKELQEDMLDRWDYRTENLYPLVANGRMAEAEA